MPAQQPTTDRSRSRRHRPLLTGGLVGLGVVVAVRDAVSDGESGPLILLQRLVLVGVIVVLLGLVIQKLSKHLPAHPILAAFVCAVSAVILSIPVFVAFNILIPTQGKQAHMWGDVEAIDRFYKYVVFGIPGAAILGACAGAYIAATRRESDSGDQPRFVK